jgi:copper chaperone CopZ
MGKKTYKVLNMDCASCALLIEGELEDAGFKGICSYAKQTLEVTGEHDEKKIKEVVKKAGYELSSQ